MLERYADCQKLFRCPLCGAPLSINSQGSLLCGSGHCYDIAAKGYVNFVQNMKRTIYDEKLFENRRNAFTEGFYEGVLRGIVQMCGEFFAGKRSLVLLDAGCGEGYYIKELLKHIPEDITIDIFGLDISSQAVRMAAGGRDIKWIVGDIANIPLADDSVDIILNILTPANYGEFGRVLKPGGIIVKVVPGGDYLKEIRALLPGMRPYQENRVPDYFERKVDALCRKTIYNTYPVTPVQARCLLGMTPLTRNADINEIDTSKLKEITIHVEMIAGTIKEL